MVETVTVVSPVANSRVMFKLTGTSEFRSRSCTRREAWCAHREVIRIEGDVGES